MSNKPIIPLFQATREGTPDWTTQVNIINNNVVPVMTCYTIEPSTLQMSLDGGKEWRTMDRVNELIELGEQYEDLMRMKQEQYEAMNS